MNQSDPPRAHIRYKRIHTPPELGVGLVHLGERPLGALAADAADAAERPVLGLLRDLFQGDVAAAAAQRV